MDTKQLIELVADALAGNFVDWRQVATKLDSSDFDIDTPCDTKGWTLLQWALEHDNNQAASFAISRNASINAKGIGDFDCTPLDIAVRKGNDKYIDMFLRYGGTASVPATSKRMELIKKGKVTIQKFVTDSDSDSFADVIKHYEQLLDVKPKRDKQTGVIRFRNVSLADALSLTGNKKEQLRQVVTKFAEFSIRNRKHGAILYGESWLGASLKKSNFVLAPTDADMVLLTALTTVPKSPLFGNHQLFGALVELYQFQKYRILSINKDAIVVQFVEDIKDHIAAAEEAIRLFPFLPEYHTAGAAQPNEIDVNEIVANDIRNENALHIIYHAF